MSAVAGIASAFGVGLAAGLGVAVPLGAIGVLLLREGVERGVRRAAVAAAAVSCVDVMYCAAAMLVGRFAGPAVEGLGSWPEVIGALLLVVVAAAGIARGLRRCEPATQHWQSPRSSNRFAFFFGLTAINPVTLVYFTAIAATLEQSLGGGAAIAIVTGVGLASLLWQLLLVWIGAVVGAGSTARTRRLTILVGNVVVGALGVVMLASAAR
ncbi:LysE type translocator [Mycobacterium marinum]|uniref:LysE type translocator n=1 Tax=Mycobacterium marinum TaxID=1781 RepID=A0A3E2N1Q5_MYCMR|nr:hypothetical protein [Mycobacterium marinum]RFZ46725.1 LysE type translocator [Mycobacterium marinum]